MTVLILARDVDPQIDRVVDDLNSLGVPVFRSLSAAAIAEDGGVKVAYTRRLGPDDLADLAGVETTAHLFQQFIEPKQYEARVTVVGDRFFAAAIHAGSPATEIDFRADYASLRYSVVEPPDDVRIGMRAFLAAFGLTFGAFDFVVDRSGRWWLLECNPFGAYGWLEDELGFPITSALGDLLAAGLPQLVDVSTVSQ